MKRMLFMALFAALQVASAHAEGEQQGSCGLSEQDDVKWSIVANVLFIGGTGAMTNYEWTTDRPWHGEQANITSVIVYGNVTSIGDKAFADLPALQAVSLAESVAHLGKGAFYSCPNLKKVDLSGLAQLAVIGKETFLGDAALSEVKLPASLTEIGESAFWGCTSLATPVFAPGTQLREIGALAFWRCGSMTNFTVAASVTNVGTKAFGWCTGLERVVFLGTGTEVASNGFVGVGWDLSEPLYFGQMLDLLLKDLDIGSDMIVANEATEDIQDDYACYSPLYATKLPKLTLPEGWKGLVYVDPRTPWACGYFVAEGFAIPWGTFEYPWHIGATEDDPLFAYIQNGILCIVGSGNLYPYTSVDELPWAGKIAEIKEISFESGLVYLAKLAAFDGFDSDVVITGLAGMTLQALRGESAGGAITPAGAERIEIADGKVHLGVSVATNADLSAATETWQKADIEAVQKESDGTVTLTVPATAESGFMILRSKPAGK